MIAFLDTEFTDLVIRPRLLSVGLVTDIGGGREFYAEVVDRDRIHAASWFALCAVLPQFGKVACAACTYAELAARLTTFLDELTTTLKADERIEIAYGYQLDWELVDLAIKDSSEKHWASTRRRLQPMNVYDITGFNSAKRAAESYFKSQAAAAFSRHHALCDARALRVAYEAATRDAAGPSETTRSLAGPAQPEASA